MDYKYYFLNDKTQRWNCKQYEDPNVNSSFVCNVETLVTITNINIIQKNNILYEFYTFFLAVQWQLDFCSDEVTVEFQQIQMECVLLIFSNYAMNVADILNIHKYIYL